MGKGTYELLEDLKEIGVYGRTEHEREVAKEAMRLIELLLKEREEYRNCTK